MNLRLFVLALISCSFLVTLTASAESGAEKNLNCINMFDVLALLAAPVCATQESSDRAPELNAAIELLIEHRFVSPSQFRDIDLKFCPLNFGLGLVPQPNTIIIDDGLRQASTDTLAEIIVHELEHVTQMRTMGAADFKCGYINALVDCGGCYDEKHPLEAPAYEAQARVRGFLLAKWKQHYSSANSQ